MPALRAKRGSGGAQRGSRAVAPAWVAVIEGGGSGSPVTKSPTAAVNVTGGLADGAGVRPSRAKRGDGWRAARSACARAGVGCWHRGRGSAAAPTWAPKTPTVNVLGAQGRDRYGD